jgi:hypothetical protein
MPQFISLQKAIDMTSLYRAQKENILVPQLRNQKITPICETFDRSAFESLLAISGCVSLRFYVGMDTNMKIRLIAVAVNSAGEDILAHDPEIVEDGQRCPDICPSASPLNS